MTDVPSIPASQFSGTLPELPPISDIPPPHLAAPWIYIRMPAAAPPPMPWPVGNSGPALNQYFNWMPAQNLMPMQAQQPWMSRPMPSPMPPPMPPEPPPQPAQPPAQPPAPPPVTPKEPVANVDPSALNDEVIRFLNKRLNDPNEDVRADAAVDFYRILERNPDLPDSPVYKPYVDAFLEKILKDPAPTVRGGGELCLQMGRVRHPSKGVKDQLKKISQKTGITSEDRLATNILGELASATLRVPKAPLPPPPNPLGNLAKGLPASPTAAPAPAPSPASASAPMPTRPVTRQPATQAFPSVSGAPPGMPTGAPWPGGYPPGAGAGPRPAFGGRINRISAESGSLPEATSIGQRLNIQEGFKQ